MITALSGTAAAHTQILMFHCDFVKGLIDLLKINHAATRRY